MDNALRNALMVEVEDLFAQHKVFQQRRPTHTRLEAVLVVGNTDALIGGQVAFSPMGTPFGHALVSLAAAACVGVESGLVRHRVFLRRIE